MPFVHIPFNATARIVGETNPASLLGTLVDVARGSYGDMGPVSRGVNSDLPEWLPGVTRIEPDAANASAQWQNYGNDPLPRGVQPLNERLARNGVGAAIGALGAYLVGQGIITGPTPPPGKPRDSIEIGGAWVPLYRVPLGSTLKIGAEIHDAIAEGRSLPEGAGQIVWDTISQDTPLSTGIRVAAALFDAAAHGYVSGEGLQGAISQPKFQQMLDDQGARWVPAGGLLRAIGNYTDPYDRQAHSVTEAVGRMIPGVRNTLSPKLGDTGHPIPNPRYGFDVNDDPTPENALRVANILNPFTGHQEPDDPVQRVLADHDVSIKKPAASHPPEHKQNEERWTPEQADLYRQELGRRVEANVNAVTARPDFRRGLDDPRTFDARQKLLQKAVDDARQDVHHIPAELKPDGTAPQYRYDPQHLDLSARLNSLKPDALAAAAREYAQATTPAARNQVAQKVGPAFRDYERWAKYHGNAPIGDQNTVDHFLAMRP